MCSEVHLQVVEKGKCLMMKGTVDGESVVKKKKGMILDGW